MANSLQKKLNSILASTEMTKHDIGRIIINNGLADSYHIKIDVHGYNVEQVGTILRRIISIDSPYISNIEVVHGFRGGKAIKDFLQYEFAHPRIQEKTPSDINQGITHISIKRHEKTKKIIGKKKKTSHQKKSEPSTKSIVELFEETSFMLVMLQDKIKGLSLQIPVLDARFLEYLSVDEVEFCTEIVELGLSKDVFLNRIRGFYNNEGTRYLKAKVKSLDQLKKGRIIEAAINSWSDRSYVLVFEVNEAKKDKISKYISRTWPCHEIELKPGLIILNQSPLQHLHKCP